MFMFFDLKLSVNLSVKEELQCRAGVKAAVNEEVMGAVLIQWTEHYTELKLCI